MRKSKSIVVLATLIVMLSGCYPQGPAIQRIPYLTEL
jgi:hypothetical protein